MSLSVCLAALDAHGTPAGGVNTACALRSETVADNSRCKRREAETARTAAPDG